MRVVAATSEPVTVQPHDPTDVVERHVAPARMATSAADWKKAASSSLASKHDWVVATWALVEVAVALQQTTVQVPGLTLGQDGRLGA